MPAMKNDKLLRTKSGMLKLQQMYLSKQLSDTCDQYRSTIGQEVDALEVVGDSYSAIGALLHRHTISDPSYNKLTTQSNSNFESIYEHTNTTNDIIIPSPRRRRKHVSQESTESKSNLSVKPLPTQEHNDEFNNTTEFDSPSEGYHSQQSSGSPTPSSERSSMHFAENDVKITAIAEARGVGASPHNKQVFISRKSSEILTKLADV